MLVFLGKKSGMEVVEDRMVVDLGPDSNARMDLDDVERGEAQPADGGSVLASDADGDSSMDEALPLPGGVVDGEREVIMTNM